MLRYNVLLALLFVHLSATFFTTQAIPFNERDDADSADEKPAEHVPTFISQPQKLYTDPGESVSISCQVKDLEPYVLMWSKDTNLLRVGETSMINDERFVFKNHALIINNFDGDDEGEYKCQISSEPPLELVNIIRLKADPKIHFSPDKKVIEVKEGDVLSLKCPSEGQPPPKIIWQNEEAALRSTITGELKDNNETLEFSNIQGTDAGQFECIADNGGTKDKHVFTVKIRHTPILKVEKTYYPSSPGVNLDIVCVVKADPPAHITWYKDGKNLVGSDRVHIKVKDHHSSVKITNVKDVDFGIYKCEAKNEMGKTSADITASGAPNQMTFLSKPDGNTEDSYLLEFYTESMSPIIEYRLMILKSTSEKIENDDWKEVIIPAIAQSSPRYKDKYEIEGLQPATVYDVYMTARNHYGRSIESERFRFTTLGGFIDDQRVTDAHSSSATPETVGELKPLPNDAANGSPTFNQRAKVVAIMTVIILIAFFY